MKKYYRRIFEALYYLAYLFIYIGFLRYKFSTPAIFDHQLKYFLFLIIILLPFFLPTAIRFIVRAIGWRRMFFSIISAAVFLFILYSISAIVYYHSKKAREHLFDPYLQIHNRRFDESVKKSEDTYRILCLGGSTTLCDRLPAPARYPNVLQTILQEKYPLAKIEVLNAGQHWYTTKHSLINYMTYYQLWEPDLVILMHGINDLYRSFSPPDFAIGEYDDQWSHFYGPAIGGARQRTLEQKIVGRLRRIATKYASIWYPAFRKKTGRYKQGKEYQLERFRSIKMFEKYLIWTARYIKDNKTDILLVSQPSLYREDMNLDEIKVLWFAKTLCYSINRSKSKEFPNYESLYGAMRAFNRVVEQVASSEDVIFVDAANKIPKNIHYFKDDCHYEEPGARLLAQVIAEAVIKSGIIDKISEGVIQ